MMTVYNFEYQIISLFYNRVNKTNLLLLSFYCNFVNITLWMSSAVAKSKGHPVLFLIHFGLGCFSPACSPAGSRAPSNRSGRTSAA